MSKPVQDQRGPSLKNNSNKYIMKLFQSLNQISKMQETLMINVSSINYSSSTSKVSQWLFNLQIKHQVLFLTLILIIIVTAMFIGINNIHMNIFTTLLTNGFNQMLEESNANFQTQVLLKYMSLTRNFFQNDQQSLWAIQQMFNYTLQQQYSIDLGVECPLMNKSGNQPSFQKIDLFCYVPHAAKDLQTFENSTLNTEFVKLTNVLNQFILCFGFQRSFAIKNVLQMNLDNKEQLSSYYPQSSPFPGYVPSSRPFFQFQKQQYQANVTRKFYISNYLKFYTSNGATEFGQTLTLSLLNRTQFSGIIAVSISFSVFNEVLQNFPDINLALIANDGTVLFQQNQLQKQDHQQFIYNQSSTGYNYFDWINLSAHQDYKQQIIMNNTLFAEPIKVNIKKFQDLPYYFIVYNNLTYENQIKAIQVEIFNKITIQYKITLLVFMIIFIILLIVVYFVIQQILKPLAIIKQIIYCHNQKNSLLNYLREPKQSNNIFYILQFIIYLKYSELQNLSFKKSIQCQSIENMVYQINNYRKKANDLVKILYQNAFLIFNVQQDSSLDSELLSNNKSRFRDQ